MAHKKAGGSTRLGRDSRAQRLGVKLFDGQFAPQGAVLVRQHGTKIHAGDNVKRGGGDTLFAMVNGLVKFNTKKMRKFSGCLKATQFINIIPGACPESQKNKFRKRTKALVTKPTFRHRH